jgi:hypothetical protein
MRRLYGESSAILTPVGLCSADFEPGSPSGGGSPGGQPGGEPAAGGGGDDGLPDAGDGGEGEPHELSEPGSTEAEGARAELGALTQGLDLNLDIEGEFAKEAGQPGPLDVPTSTRLLQSLARTGLKGAPARELVLDFIKLQAEQFREAHGAALQDAITTDMTVRDLKTEWGKDFDANLIAVQTTFRDLAAEDFEQLDGLRLEDGSRITDNPAVAQMLLRASQRLTAGAPAAAMPPASASTPAAPAPAAAPQPAAPATLADLKRRLAQIESDPAQRRPLWDGNHPMHRIAKQEWNQLIEQIAALEGARDPFA